MHTPHRQAAQAHPTIALLAALAATPAAATVAFSAEQVLTSTLVDARSVIAADLDRDGDLDVIAGGSGVLWFENVPGAGFTEHPLAAFGASELAVGDLDGDGDLDLASTSVDLTWHENDGNQVFASHSLTTDGVSYQGVSFADVDRDGDLDVVSTENGAPHVAWHRNDGGGVFTKLTVGTGPHAADGLDVADFDRDGDLDALSTWPADNRILWHENDGDQTFTEHSISNVALGARDVVAVDLDRDGDLDAVAATTNDGTIAWFRNNGNGTFTRLVISADAASAQSVAAGDLDGDGDLDVVTVSSLDDTVAWHENDGTQSFAERLLSTAADGAKAVAVADLDGDGDQDVVAASTTDATVAWYANLTATSSAFLPTASPVDAGGDEPAGIAAGDIDLDGDQDLVVATAGDDQVSWHENAGASFIEHPLAVGDAELVDGVTGVELFDLDRDGDLDVLSAAMVGWDVAWHQNPVRPGTSSTWAHHPIDGLATGVEHATAGDLDRDGDLDVVAAVGGANEVTWYPNDGTGAFGPTDVLASNALAVRSVELGDLDGDGDLDVVFAEATPSDLDWLENDGDRPPTFTRRIATPLVGPRFWVRILDFDCDGLDDLVTTGFPFSDVTLHRNNGGSPPTFPSSISATTVHEPTDLDLADLDRDGNLDLLVAGSQSDRVFWIEKTCTDSFIARPLPPPLDGVVSLVAADLDGDGDLDLATANELADTVTWLPNLPAIFWDDFEADEIGVWSAIVP